MDINISVHDLLEAGVEGGGANMAMLKRMLAENLSNYVRNSELKPKTHQILEDMRIFVDSKTLTVTIDPKDWERDRDNADGYICTIQDNAIRKNHDIELVSCKVSSKEMFNIIAQTSCKEIDDGKLVIRVPGENKPGLLVRLGFNLKEYVLKEVE